MSKQAGNSINFYTAYQKTLGKRRISVRQALYILTAAVLTLGLSGAYALISRSNADKRATLDRLDAESVRASEAYETALLLEETSKTAQDFAQALARDAALEKAFPVPDRNLLERVNECAGTTFTVSAYRYDEDTATLELDASAASVNDMPDLVEALRATGLFSLIQYIGYTSDTDGVYYCTVGCMLRSPETEAAA